MVSTASLVPRCAVLVVSVVALSPAAAETTKSFPVTATVVNGCVVATGGGGSWGTIDLGSVPGATAASAQASLVSTAGAGISIECTPGLTAGLVADAGDHAVAGGRFLKLSGGTATVGYQLYADGASTPWTTNSVPLSFPTGASKRLVPVRAVATLPGPRPAGSYADTVRVTLSW